jgi:hypothetical protein
MGVPTPTFVPPTVFLTLSTAYSSLNLAGLFHPTATSRIRASGVFPAAKPPRLIDAPCPHVVRPKSPPGELPLRCQILEPHFQGVNPSSDPL